MQGTALCKAQHNVKPTVHQPLAPAQSFLIYSTDCTSQVPHLRARSSSISAWRSAARSCLALSRAVSSSFSLAARTFSSCWACSGGEAMWVKKTGHYASGARCSMIHATSLHLDHLQCSAGPRMQPAPAEIQACSCTYAHLLLRLQGQCLVEAASQHGHAVSCTLAT